MSKTRLTLAQHAESRARKVHMRITYDVVENFEHAQFFWLLSNKYDITGVLRRGQSTLCYVPTITIRATIEIVVLIVE